MPWHRALGALAAIDARTLRRDPLLRWMAALPILLALLIRWGLPPVASWAQARFGADLAAYDPLILSALVMTAPTVIGMVIGFLLLEERDARTLNALRVTPLPASGYVAYRLAAPMLVSAVATVAAVALTGRAGIGPGRQLLAAAGAAPLAPAYALVLAAFARNKVQGFALMKAASALNWPPLLAWWVQSRWQLAFGLCPTYWPAKLYWELEAAASPVWPFLLAGSGYLALVVVALARKFESGQAGTA